MIKTWISLNRGKVLLGLAVIVGFIIVMSIATSDDNGVVSEAEGGVAPIVTDTDNGFVTE